MFKHILIPTDGSPLSEAAIREGVRLAARLQAKVTGLCAMPVNPPFFYETEIPKEALEQVEKRTKELAESYLAAIEKVAREAGVGCELVFDRAGFPFEAIIRVAQQKQCDLIVMASHGRRGVKALLIGSETQKVLTHTKIPVLVVR